MSSCVKSAGKELTPPAPSLTPLSLSLRFYHHLRETHHVIEGIHVEVGADMEHHKLIHRHPLAAGLHADVLSL